MNRRLGATLVEVLVTIFIMGIGLLSLLTLFPIGALSMAQAIKDSRSAQAVGNANAIATARNLRNDPSVTSHYLQPPGAPAAPLDGPSYPVYMDPIGVRSYSGSPLLLRDWVGAVGPLGIRRVQPNFISAPPPQPVPPNIQIQRMLLSFSLLDDITFGPDGVPVGLNGQPTPTGGDVQREGRYTWGLLFKRPKTATPSVVDLTVVVYSGRPLQFTSPTGSPVGETAYQNTQTVGVEGSNVLTLIPDPGQERPNIKKGSWILDATAEPPFVPNAPAGTPQPVLKYGPVHGIFYRVANFTELSGGGLELELDRPLRAPIDNAPGLGNVRRLPRIIVMDNVAEVFEKGPGWQP